MATLQVSCSDDTPDMYQPTVDPPHGRISALNAPSILCDTRKGNRDIESAAPISVTVAIDSNLTVPQYCTVGIFEDLYIGIGEQVACEYRAFTASGTMVFNDFNLADGRYIVIAGLSQFTFCSQWLQYDTTAWHHLVVGGDSCATWRTFEFDYYRQGTLNAVPKGLSHVQQSYDAGRISLSMYTVGDTLSFEQITVRNWLSGDDLFDYMVDHVQTELGFDQHLFAVRRFVDISGYVYPAYGRTLYRDFGDEPSFVCVSRVVADFYGPDTTEAVSSTTTHELGHLVARLTDACEEAPDSHVVGQCIMEDIAYNNGLKLYCGFTGQYWPYTNAFCDSCVRRLEVATW